MEYKNLLIENVAGVATLTVNRPQALNALNSELLGELACALYEIEYDPAIKVVVLTGAGDKAFVAGADIGEMSALSALEARRFADLGHRTLAALEALDVPTIAAVNGFALGGGCELALACDLVYASDRARFGQPEVNLGLIPGFGGTQRLTRRVGVGKARELVYTGDIVDAQEAHRIGLVQELTEPGKQLDRAIAIAETIAAQAPLGVRATLESARRARNEEAAARALLPELVKLMKSDDAREGLMSFIERRAANFTGK